MVKINVKVALTVDSEVKKTMNCKKRQHMV